MNLLAERQSLALTKFEYVRDVDLSCSVQQSVIDSCYTLNVAGVIVPTFWDISSSDSAVAVDGLLSMAKRQPAHACLHTSGIGLLIVIINLQT